MLGFSHCRRMTAKGVSEIIRKSPHVQKVDLSYNMAASDVLLRCIGHWAKRLTFLDLSYCLTVTDTGLTSLAQVCDNLRGCDADCALLR